MWAAYNMAETIRQQELSSKLAWSRLVSPPKLMPRGSQLAMLRPVSIPVQ